LKKARKEWKDIWLEDRKNTERSKFLKNMFVRSTKVSGDSKEDFSFSSDDDLKF